jgi:hypothetical protein
MPISAQPVSARPISAKPISAALPQPHGQKYLTKVFGCRVF